MELLSSELHYILVKGGNSLWINRKTCSFTDKNAFNFDSLNPTPTCLGLVHGLIGKLDFSDNCDTRLVFIKRRQLVGVLRGCELFKISSVVSLPLETDIDVHLDPCPKCQGQDAVSKVLSARSSDNAISAEADVISSRNLARVKPATSVPAQSITSSKRMERIDKVDKRVLEEFHKMFTEADSFYYSNDYDITNTTQRTFLGTPNKSEESKYAQWYQADTRFIWNMSMIDDLIRSKDTTLDKWILPIIQGFVQHETCEVENLFDHIGPDVITIQGHLELWLISRRSRFRAGTRYRRRGIDENGKTANYVETEQIVIFNTHVISFVQTRGSIPIYWSQPGFRYRPPPRIEKAADESFIAFKKHIAEEERIYGPVYLVSLVDKTGKEKILGDGFMEMVVRYNDEGLTYLTFDFHESCRGMHFENVATLISKLMESIKSMNYCWIDSYGVVLQQKGVCRINCVDCLDRTNVVQTHLGKYMMTNQLSKLGLLAPEIGLPENLKLKLQSMWANNGDIISRQYAGTNALKGDYTRTGERRIAGALRDGMNSANRYYLNRFKDAYRQAAIDAMLGMRRNFTEDYLDAAVAGRPGDEGENTAEQIKTVIEDAKKCVVPKFDVILGSWGLVNAKNNDADTIDIDVIFILTEKHYYATEYDCNVDAITDTQKVHLTAIVSLELGFEPLIQPSNFWSFFHHGANVPQVSTVPSLRINYKTSGEVHFHQFRSSNIRFFNNVTLQIEQPEEMFDALKMIAQAIKAAAQHIGHKVKIEQCTVLPTKEPTKTNTPAVATSWVHRYFHFAPTDVEHELPRKVTTMSFERFTPKYFRRGSAAAAEGPAGMATVFSVSNSPQGRANQVTSAKGEDSTNTTKNLSLLLKTKTSDITNSVTRDAESILATSSTTTNIDLQIPFYPSFNQLKSNDLVLPSCGIIAVSTTLSLVQNYQHISLSLLPTPLSFPPSQLDGCEEHDNLSASPSPCFDFPSPIVDPMSNSNKGEVGIVMATIFPRHRNSLPSQSLLGFTGSPQRSITPEIRITEEGPDIPSTMKALAVSSALSLKRMSKSSEDVTNVPAKNSSITAMKNTKTETGNTHLTLTAGLDSARSTSVQDLTGSVLNMKSSLSENTLRGNKFQAPQQTTTSSKKGLVFAPLGKLARGMQNIGTQYFDPRKIRDTFKPQNSRKETELTNEEKEELRILEEKKSESKSVIIEL